MGQILIALANFLVFAWEGKARSWFIILAISLQNCFCLYNSYLIAKSLSLRKEIIESMDMNDVLRCFHWAISTLAEGQILSENINAKEILKALKSTYEIKPLELLRRQQLRELSSIYSFFTSEIEISLDDMTDPEIIAAARSLELFCKKEVDYFQKLNNLKNLEDAIVNKRYNIKALEVSLLTQANFNYLAKKNKQLLKRPRENDRVDNTYDKENEIEINLDYNNVESSLARELGHCVWLSTKDILPVDKELALLSEEYEGDIK